MKKDIKFTKYKKRGAYHWQQISNSILNHNAFVSARYNQVVNQIPKNPSQIILDIGCGEGVLVYLIFKKTKSQITGIDTDQLSLEFAKSKFKSLKVKAKFFKANAYKLPFKNNTFDTIVSAEVIEHLSDTHKYLSEIKRVLKPGGKVIITTPVKLSEIPKDKMHVKEFTPQEFQEILNKYFKTINIKTSHPLFLRNLYILKLGKINRFYLEPFKWLINLWIILTKLNPFKLSFGQPTNQIAILKNSYDR